MRAALIGLILSACTPGVVWRGASPEHDSHAEIMHLRADQWVRIDGKDGPVYDGIGAGSVVFSPDASKVAYAARRKHAWRVVIQDASLRGKPVEGPAVDGLGDLRWRPDGAGLVYEAERGGRWHVVHHALDEREHWGPPREALFEGTLRFDGDAYGYVASEGACVQVIVVEHNEAIGPCFDRVGALVLSNGRFAYAASDAAGAHVVVDGEVGPAHEQISALAMADAVAYVARDGERAVVVHQGKVVDAADDITGLTLGEGRAAWVVRVGDRQHLVVDGVRGPARDLVDTPIFGGGVVGHIEKQGAETRVMLGNELIGSHADAGELVLAGKRWAYVANDGKPAVVVDGVAFPMPALLPGTLQFAADGTHWGCLTGDPVSRDVMLVIDGAVRRALDFEALAAHLQARLKQGREADVDTFLRAWVAAELTRPAPEER